MTDPIRSDISQRYHDRFIQQPSIRENFRSFGLSFARTFLRIFQFQQSFRRIEYHHSDLCPIVSGESLLPVPSTTIRIPTSRYETELDWTSGLLSQVDVAVLCPPGGSAKRWSLSNSRHHDQLVVPRRHSVVRRPVPQQHQHHLPPPSPSSLCATTASKTEFAKARTKRTVASAFSPRNHNNCNIRHNCNICYNNKNMTTMKQQTACRSKAPHRRVRFATKTQLHSIHNMAVKKTDCERLWWQKEEMRTFRKQALSGLLSTVREQQQQQQQQQHNDDNTAETIANPSLSYSDTIRSIHEFCITSTESANPVLASHLAKGLLYWTIHKASVRGLEKVVTTSRKGAVRRLLEMQTAGRREGLKPERLSAILRVWIGYTINRSRPTGHEHGTRAESKLCI